VNRSRRRKRITRKKHKGGNAAKEIELVVARYAEDIRWINDFPKGIFKRIKIYNKGADLDYTIEGAEVIKLENIGREPHTYLTHIVNNYDNKDSNELVTLFLPGSVKNKPYKSIQLDKIWDSLKNNHKSIILSVASDKQSIEKEKGLRVPEYISTNNGNKKLNPNARVNRSHDGSLGEWFYKHFPGEEIKCLSINCIFAVTKNDIHKRKLDFYKGLLNMVSSKHPEIGHYMERLWSSILSIDNCELYDIKGHPHAAYKEPNTK
jgi:hypothetical protein